MDIITADSRSAGYGAPFLFFGPQAQLSQLSQLANYDYCVREW